VSSLSEAADRTVSTFGATALYCFLDSEGELVRVRTYVVSGFGNAANQNSATRNSMSAHDVESNSPPCRVETISL